MTDHNRRRSDREFVDGKDYHGPERRYFDRKRDVHVVKIYSGDCYVTNREKEMLVTILGSCVAACIRDPVARVGGMNHFLLSDGGSKDDPMQAMRYGAFSMEQLINGILKLGGKKERLEVKLFGGGNVIQSSAMIGDKNVKFVRNFCKEENLAIAGEDLGGNHPRRIHYYSDSGKVMLRTLQRSEDMAVVEEEKQYASRIVAKPGGGDVDLF